MLWSMIWETSREKDLIVFRPRTLLATILKLCTCPMLCCNKWEHWQQLRPWTACFQHGHNYIGNSMKEQQWSFQMLQDAPVQHDDHGAARNRQLQESGMDTRRAPRCINLWESDGKLMELGWDMWWNVMKYLFRRATFLIEGPFLQDVVSQVQYKKEMDFAR